MALAYRAALTEQAARANELEGLLYKVDLRMLGRKHPGLVEAVEKLLAGPSSKDPVGELDQRFRDWGETWHAEIPVDYDEDDLIPAKEAAAIVSLNSHSISALRVRGRIKGTWDRQLRGYRYRVGDVYTLMTEKRARGGDSRSSTDTVPNSGSSATK